MKKLEFGLQDMGRDFVRDAGGTDVKENYDSKEKNTHEKERQHAVAEPQTVGQRMGTGAPAVLLQKIEAILGRCVFDQPDNLTYDEGVKLVRELVASAHAAEQSKLTEEWAQERAEHIVKILHGNGSYAWNKIDQRDIAVIKLALLTSPVAPPPPYPASAQSPKQVGDKILISDKEKCWLAQVISRLDDLDPPPVAPGEQPPRRERT